MIDQDDKTLIRRPILPAKLAPASQTGSPSIRTGSRSINTDSRNTQSGATHSSWSNPGAWPKSNEPPLATGSVIKGRFVLEEPIGRGGMGTVFRARDLRKEEAQDRNPYVAIKV